MPSEAITGSTVTNPVELNQLDKIAKNKTTIDKDGFLKLFVAQMQNQDPTASQDPGESMQQMTQFSMLEQMTNMAAENTKIAQSLTASNAVGLIGRTVTYVDADKVEQTGKVESVTTGKDGKSSLTVAGKTGIDPTSITQVA
jgi:flagellar basal-body rod modification protein FlgD